MPYKNLLFRVKAATHSQMHDRRQLHQQREQTNDSRREKIPMQSEKIIPEGNAVPLSRNHQKNPVSPPSQQKIGPKIAN
jgi:hypothetical protein